MCLEPMIIYICIILIAWNSYYKYTFNCNVVHNRIIPFSQDNHNEIIIITEEICPIIVWTIENFYDTKRISLIVNKNNELYFCDGSDTTIEQKHLTDIPPIQYPYIIPLTCVNSQFKVIFLYNFIELNFTLQVTYNDNIIQDHFYFSVKSSNNNEQIDKQVNQTNITISKSTIIFTKNYTKYFTIFCGNSSNKLIDESNKINNYRWFYDGSLVQNQKTLILEISNLKTEVWYNYLCLIDENKYFYWNIVVIQESSYLNSNPPFLYVPTGLIKKINPYNNKLPVINKHIWPFLMYQNVLAGISHLHKDYLYRYITHNITCKSINKKKQIYYHSWILDYNGHFKFDHQYDSNKSCYYSNSLNRIRYKLKNDATLYNDVNTFLSYELSTTVYVNHVVIHWRKPLLYRHLYDMDVQYRLCLFKVKSNIAYLSHKKLYSYIHAGNFFTLSKNTFINYTIHHLFPNTTYIIFIQTYSHLGISQWIKTNFTTKSFNKYLVVTFSNGTTIFNNYSLQYTLSWNINIENMTDSKDYPYYGVFRLIFFTVINKNLTFKNSIIVTSTLKNPSVSFFMPCIVDDTTVVIQLISPPSKNYTSLLIRPKTKA